MGIASSGLDLESTFFASQVLKGCEEAVGVNFLLILLFKTEDNLKGLADLLQRLGSIIFFRLLISRGVNPRILMLNTPHFQRRLRFDDIGGFLKSGTYPEIPVHFVQLLARY